MTEEICCCPSPDVHLFDDVLCCISCGKTALNHLGCYQYRRLNHLQEQEIRLLELLPGQATDALACNIRHVDLTGTPVFEAVSYVTTVTPITYSESESYSQIHMGRRKWRCITFS